MLRYVLRVRDLVHGTTMFTALERAVINHPFFQRLRQVRQNDVAFYVYPSLNTSRFEHVLGTCRVAGMMAEHLTTSPKWKTYRRHLKSEANIASADEFVQLARLYALLHDIGHLPLSHLFEEAVREREKMARPHMNSEAVARDWTGVAGFAKLHEAFGAALVPQIIQDINLTDPLRSALLKLMTEKELPFDHPLTVVKLIVDSEIDADRIDAIRRDGVLAGSEYGNYDIRRLCDSVFIEQEDATWLVVYSEYALTSMEALLLDRYRVHLWVHYHHRVVAMKMLVRALIMKALERGIITKDAFNQHQTEGFAVRDDVWLWRVLRELDTVGDPTLAMIKRAVMVREQRNVFSLWTNRLTYHALRDRVKRRARVEDFDYGADLDRYCTDFSAHVGLQALGFAVRFTPVSEQKVPLYLETDRRLANRSLFESSRLVRDLNGVAQGDPRLYILLVGDNARERSRELTEAWVTFTAQWIRH